MYQVFSICNFIEVSVSSWAVHVQVFFPPQICLSDCLPVQSHWLFISGGTTARMELCCKLTGISLHGIIQCLIKNENQTWLWRLVPREFCHFTLLLMQTVGMCSVDQQGFNQKAPQRSLWARLCGLSPESWGYVWVCLLLKSLPKHPCLHSIRVTQERKNGIKAESSALLLLLVLTYQNNFCQTPGHNNTYKTMLFATV